MMDVPSDCVNPNTVMVVLLLGLWLLLGCDNNSLLCWGWGSNSPSQASPNFRLMLSFLLGDFFHQSEVARPYSWQVKKLEAIFQK